MENLSTHGDRQIEKRPALVVDEIMRDVRWKMIFPNDRQPEIGNRRDQEAKYEGESNEK